MNSVHKTVLTPGRSAPAGKQIVICADDFGMNPAIDEAILTLVQLERLSAVSCLAQAPSLAADALRLSVLAVDIGLHLNFTESFAGEHIHLPLSRLIAACYLHLLPKTRVAAQIECQLDAFETHFHRPPDYIDGHQHVHQLPIIRENLLEIISRRYPEQSIWLRSTTPALPLQPHRRASPKAHIIALLGARKLRSLANSHGLPMNARLAGVYDFSASAAGYRSLLIDWLRAAGDGDLLMCHPAVSTANTDQRFDPIGEQRVREYCILSAPEFPTWLDDAAVRITRLAQGHYVCLSSPRANKLQSLSNKN